MTFSINEDFLGNLITQAKDNERKRSHYKLHKEHAEPVQRLCIGLIKGTYVRPHRHPSSNAWEMMLSLKGSVMVPVFDDDGYVLEKYELSQSEADSAIELPPKTWHMVLPLSLEAIILEVKEGPYVAEGFSEFAEWAPMEGEPDVNNFVRWAERAVIGDKYNNEY